MEKVTSRRRGSDPTVRLGLHFSWRRTLEWGNRSFRGTPGRLVNLKSIWAVRVLDCCPVKGGDHCGAESVDNRSDRTPRCRGV